jgi:hypothetical protein
MKRRERLAWNVAMRADQFYSGFMLVARITWHWHAA